MSDEAAFQTAIAAAPDGDALRLVFDQITAFGKVDAPVLIEGESGTGKQEVARAIHQASAARRSGPLVDLNCAAYSEALLESVLLGHVKGGFARPEPMVRPGAFEEAHGGTLFLDHVENLPPGIRHKLLRGLQERRIIRIGDVHEVAVDVRVIASTPSLKHLVGEGAFCPDLFCWLGMLHLRLPPLRPQMAPHWRTETVIALARAISEFQQFDTLPILGDALEESGCDNQRMLEHCREPGEHVRSCWVAELLLGGE